MGHWRQYIPSPYQAATDKAYETGDLTGTIRAHEGVTLKGKAGREDGKTLLTFQESIKPLAANVTNCKTIESMYGPDPEGWIGKKITMYRTTTPYDGQDRPCVRIRCIIGGNVVAPPAPAGPSQAEVDAARAELEEVKAQLAKVKGKKGRK